MSPASPRSAATFAPTGLRTHLSNLRCYDASQVLVRQRVADPYGLVRGRFCSADFQTAKMFRRFADGGHALAWRSIWRTLRRTRLSHSVRSAVAPWRCRTLSWLAGITSEFSSA